MYLGRTLRHGESFMVSFSVPRVNSEEQDMEEGRVCRRHTHLFWSSAAGRCPRVDYTMPPPSP
jgi:hypothetical protein